MWSIDNENTYLNSQVLNGSLHGFKLSLTNITEMFIESTATGIVRNDSFLACQADLVTSTTAIKIEGKLSHKIN